MQYDNHIQLWRLWNEYNMRPIEQVRMFRKWVDLILGNVGLDRIG